jgi:hypothetical protein
MIRLDLGAGTVSPPGFHPDRPCARHGNLPARLWRRAVDEIRASHVLEHFPARAARKVIGEWVRCLKKGGKLKIAVPDFATIAEDYLEGVEQPHESFILGGQQDVNDYHKVDVRSGALAQTAGGRRPRSDLAVEV